MNNIIYFGSQSLTITCMSFSPEAFNVPSTATSDDGPELGEFLTEAEETVPVESESVNPFDGYTLEMQKADAALYRVSEALVVASAEVFPLNAEGSLEKPPHLDAAALMKEKNCYFVHMIQVTKNLDVSENNKSFDTKKLTTADKLDILYAASPTLSVSSIRPETQDGTFYGGFGVLLSQGEIVSADPSDSGTIATSLSEREVIGGVKNSVEDIDRAIDREHGGNGKSYNEIVLKEPEVAGGFMKIDGESYKKRISYEEETRDYGSGGGEVIIKRGVLNLANEKNVAIFDTPFSVLVEMANRGPVFLMDENNQMLQVTSIDEGTRRIEFSTVPLTPSDVAEVFEGRKKGQDEKQEMLDGLSAKGINLV